MKNVMSPLLQDLWSPNLAEYWLFCGYYDRGLRSRKLAYPNISLFLSFLSKKYTVSNVKEAVEVQRKACA